MHDDQANDGCHADINEIAQREMAARLKILDDQRNKLEVKKPRSSPSTKS